MAQAMTEKSKNAFRTISEVSELLNVPAHVLRFWESKFSQIKPVKRGGGRRYYRPNDIDLIRGIRDLLYSDGLTIKGVQKILREKGVRHVTNLGVESATLWDEPGSTELELVGGMAENAAPLEPETQEPETKTPEPLKVVEAVSENMDKPEQQDFGGLFGDLPEPQPVAATPAPVTDDGDDSDVMAKIAAIAEDENHKRDKIRDIVGKLQRLRTRMIEASDIPD